jgi:type I restriction enzyme R subunit
MATIMLWPGGAALQKDVTQVYKQFAENESFKRFVGDIVAITNP